MSKTKIKSEDETSKKPRRDIKTLSTTSTEVSGSGGEALSIDWSKEIAELLSEVPSTVEEAVGLLSARVVSKLYPDLGEAERLGTIAFVSDLISANEDLEGEIRKVLVSQKR